MTSHAPNRVQINHTHSGAICTEIGERLHEALTGNPVRLPTRLLILTELLDHVERADVAIGSEFR